MTKEQAAQKILENVKEYYKTYMQPAAYKDGDYISYSSRVFDENEVINLVDSALEFWLTSGRYTEQFEKEFADYLSVKYCSLVNSGSSANLLAFMALTSPLLKERAIKPGDEIITVAAAFPTTISPIVQYGCIPVFVDITIPQYNINVNLLEGALSKKTKAVMLAHALGNPFEIIAVKEFCEKNNLWLIEDNCDSLGATYMINKDLKFTGTFGDIGTSSFYPAHQITMGEGGAVYTDNPLLHKIIRSMRDWGRDCICPPGKDNLCHLRFEKQFGGLPEGYDHKYVYSHFGYNLKATDMQAAVGCAQLKKINNFTLKRRQNWSRLREGLLDTQDKLILPEATPFSVPSWFGFMLTCREKQNRNEIILKIEENNVQTRMLFSGNILYHPCFDEMRKNNQGYRVAGTLENTDYVLNKSFWVGVHPGMSNQMIDKIITVIKDSIK